MPSVRVRSLRREDLPRWLPLWHAYLDFYRSDLSGDVTAAVFDRLVGPDPTVHGLVAVDDEQLVGFCHLVVHPNTWSVRDDTYLEDLFVVPAARGSGVGRALVEDVVARAGAGGHRRVHWLTEHDNTRARRLYDRVADLSGYVRYVVDLPAPTGSDRRDRRAVGVFCASARDLDHQWHDVAGEVGTLLGAHGLDLVYGGTDSGTMATVARAASAAGAHVTGVTLQRFVDDRFDHGACDELVVTTDLFDRKRELVVRADGFVALPGGFGTLDEIGDVIAGHRLGLHAKPLVLLDHAGFWTPLLATFELMAHTGFAAVDVPSYQVASSATQALDHVRSAWSLAADG